MGKKHPNIGSNFDDFLEEEGILEEVDAVAIKRILAWQVTQEMEKKKITKTAMAKKMKTSRPAIDRLLDPNNDSITLKTMIAAASVLGRKLTLKLT